MKVRFALSAPVGRGFGLLAILLVLLAGCRPAALPAPAVTNTPGTVSPPSVESIRFRRVTDEAGIQFRHETGASGRKYFPEWLGGGCALLDYDRDGWLDLFLVGGGRLPGWKGAGEPRDRLYHNNRNGTFTEVTLKAGIRTLHYGVGCCAGDFNGDGYLDLYVTGFKGCLLYRNNRNGTFTDVTRSAGAEPGGLCSGCAFGDYDGDGDLDLYVCRYVRYDLAHNVPCYQPHGTERVLSMCRQLVYEPAADVLYRNNGAGTFTDVTRSSGAAVEPGRGLGVLFTDFDGDGRQDLFVANDLTPNFLLHGMGGGRLQDEALERGVAFNGMGAPQAGMGVACGDVNRDGLLDLVVTNFAGEYTRLCRQHPDHRFEDASSDAGLVEATNRYVGFGVGLEDFDRDGWTDLLTVNGHVNEEAEKFYEGLGLKEPKVVLRNEGGKFLPVPEPWSDAATGTLKVGRGAAFGDLDNDGDTDVVVNNLGDAPDVLLNQTASPHHWLRLELQGKGKERCAIGARVTVWSAGRPQVKEVRSGSSYLSQNDLRLLFGLGGQVNVERVEVVWPNRQREVWSSLPVDRHVRLVQGTGRPGQSPQN